MPSATATKSVRLSLRRLYVAGKVFDRIGIDPRSAIELFLTQVALKRAIPFPVDSAESDDGYLPHVPNAVTVAALATKPTRRFRRAAAALAHLRRAS
jgi:antitoxin component of RelBE/YafQ-DinJ toxin-antitoxin module